MGEINQFDSLAMEAVAELLEDAADGILLTGLNYPEQQDDSTADVTLDVHAESARLWAGSVVDRLEGWAERARRIAAALERHELRAT
jgi:hypothetical protein